MKADVLALVQTLSNGQADPNLALVFYDEVVNELAAGEWHTTATPLTVTSGSSLVNLPSTLLRLLQMIYDDDVLSKLSLRELESLRAGWRAQNGTPIAYTLESETIKSLEVFPVPNQTPTPIIPVHGLPVGEDYQPGNAVAIYAEYRTDVLPYLNLPVALRMLSKEYIRESDHMDANYAGLAGELATMLLGMLK